MILIDLEQSKQVKKQYKIVKSVYYERCISQNRTKTIKTESCIYEVVHNTADSN